jgi:hypothetical protein
MSRRPSLDLLAGVFVAAGAILLLENLHVLSGISRLWPVLLLIAGGGFVLLFRRGGNRDTVLVWLGIFSLCVGVFFQYLTFFGWWRMATLWPIFLLIFAVCFAITSRYSHYDMVLVYIAVVFTMLFGSLYLIFGVSLSLWPFSLVAFGLSLLCVNYADRWSAKRGSRKETDVTDNSVY